MIAAIHDFDFDGSSCRSFVVPNDFGCLESLQARVWNLFCGLTAMICCCSCCPRLKRRPLLPLHWQPSVVPICAVAWLQQQTQDDSSKLLKGEGSTAWICASVLNLATLPHLTHKISPATSRTPFHKHVQSSNMFKICPELSGVGARSLGSGT